MAWDASVELIVSSSSSCKGSYASVLSKYTTQLENKIRVEKLIKF